MKDHLDRNPDVKPFEFHLPEDVLQGILTRVSTYPWHEMPDDGGWGYGTNLDYLKELCAYWVNGFDWRVQENRINSFSQYKSIVDGIDMHFIHEQGSGPNPMPLMISHGWPGSVAEFYDLIQHLGPPRTVWGATRKMLSRLLRRPCQVSDFPGVLPAHMVRAKWRMSSIN